MPQKSFEQNGTIKVSKQFWRILEMPLINCEITPVK